MQQHLVGCNPIPAAASGDPIQSNGVPFGSGGGGGGSISQFNPNQNPSNSFNSRPNYFGSSSPLMPFPTSPNAMGGFYNQPPPQSQQFGAPVPYPYVTLYGGNSNSQQMLPYYGQFRPYQGAPQVSPGISAYGGGSFVPVQTKYQTNLQFGQQPQLTSPGSQLPTLFDRMDTPKQSDEQAKKSSQQ